MDTGRNIVAGIVLVTVLAAYFFMMQGVYTAAWAVDMDGNPETFEECMRLIGNYFACAKLP